MMPPSETHLSSLKPGTQLSTKWCDPSTFAMQCQLMPICLNLPALTTTIVRQQLHNVHLYQLSYQKLS